MNLTRRILEGIHEVELEVTPEFRKTPSLQELEAALKENGWKEHYGIELEDEGYVMTWTHPDLGGANIEVTYDWKKNELLKDTITFEKGLLSSEYSATPGVVKKLTDTWKGALGDDAEPTEYPAVGKSPAVAGMIGNRSWVKHRADTISRDDPVVVTAQSWYEAKDVMPSMDASNLTYEHTPGGRMFGVYGSPGMTDDQVNKSFMTLLLALDDVLGGPKP